MKVRILKRCVNDFSQKVKEFRSPIKCRYMVKGRLISIQVLWESFHSNTPIKGELLDCIHHPPDLIHHHLSRPSSSYMSIRSMDQHFSANHLSEAQDNLPSSQLLQNHSKHNHRQVWSSRIICQDLQSFSQNFSITMTC